MLKKHNAVVNVFRDSLNGDKHRKILSCFFITKLYNDNLKKRKKYENKGPICFT